MLQTQKYLYLKVTPTFHANVDSWIKKRPRSLVILGSHCGRVLEKIGERTNTFPNQDLVLLSNFGS